MKPAFSTVACPEWTLDRVAERAEAWGYLGVELRTFGYGSHEFACDPALTAPIKTRAMFDRAGVDLAVLGTSIRFDAPISPPILGHVFGDGETSVRAAKGAIDLAARLSCPFMRVFAFEVPGSERRARAIDRIIDRLGKALDAARNSGVRLAIENGGSFPTAVDLAELMDRCASPLLVAEYNAAIAMRAGEPPERGINVLGERLAIVKLTDVKGGKACALGEGEMGCRRCVESLAGADYRGWIVHEHPRAWLGGAGDVERVLEGSARSLYAWMGKRLSTTPREIAVR